jgi:hypothetical protein
VVVYPATAPTYRTPVRRVVVAGTPLIKVLSSRVTRGWDQELATAEVLIPYPLPSHVRHRSLIQVYMGASVATNYLRFSGYVTGIDLTIWPGRILLRCEDMLALAKYYRPSASVSLEGLTDQAAVTEILEEVGLPVISGLIGGTGKTLGDDDEANPALLWEPTTTALAKIQEIDQISVYDTDDGYQGIYRTFADPGGNIRRIPLHPLPADTPAHTFTEGIDIEQGGVGIEAVEPSRVAVAAGAGGLSVTMTGTNPWATLSNPAFGLYPLVGTVDGGGTVHDLTGMASYLLQQMIANLLRIDITIRRDDLIGAYETERVIAPHGYVDILALVQSVTTEMNEGGGFTQQLSLVSYRELNIAEDIGTDDPFSGEEIPIGDPPILPEPLDALQISFLIVSIDKELAAPPDLPLDLGSTYYIVTAEDTSTSQVGTIDVQTWAASADARVLTGEGPTFTTGWPDTLEGREITLTVTDSAGNTGSLTLPVDTGAVPVRSRALFACSDTEMYANDGDQWRKRAPISGGVQCVANGPMWGCGRFIAISEDYLASEQTEVAVFGTEDVKTIWISESNSLFAAAGGADGGVAVTRDRGVTWEAKTSPGSAVNHIIVSIHDTSEIHVVTPGGWRKSQDEGATWQTVRAGNFTYLELSHSRNIVVTSAGALQKAEDGTAFTGITGTVVAATAHIREDRFYALTSDGNTWVQDTDGSFAMIAGAPLPASGTPAPAGTYRDGLMVDLVYFAANAAGVFKTLDGFTTQNGYLRILTEGRLGP